MFIKYLKDKTNEELLKILNDAQRKYNQRCELYFITKDRTDDYFMNCHLRTMNNCKKVLARRNIKVDFINGWEIVND